MKIILSILLFLLIFNSCVNPDRDNPIDQKAGNYDPNYRGNASAKNWIIKTPMPTKRAQPGVVELNGKIYVFGGVDSSFDPDKYYDVLKVYDIATDTWTTKSSMYYTCFGFSTAAINGQIYAVSYIWKVQSYNPVSDTWSMKAEVPTPRAQQAGAVLNGKLYTFGGVTSGSNVVSSVVEVYNPASDSWTTKTSMPTARHLLCVAAVNGKLYAIGGFDSNYFPLNAVEEYDPATDTWASKSKMPTYRAASACAVMNKKIYVIGGNKNDSYYTGIVEVYDPLTDTWAAESSLSAPRGWLSGTSSSNGKIYAIGGQTGSYANQVYSDMIEEYTIDSSITGFLYTPTVSGTSPTTSTTPTWTWSAATGAMKYRYGFAEGSWITETATNTSYTPSTPLSYGTYTLYVQSGDVAGNWTPSGWFAITVQNSETTYYEVYGAQTGDYTLTGHPLLGTSNNGNTFNIYGYTRVLIYVPASSPKIFFDAFMLDSGWLYRQGGDGYGFLGSYFNSSASLINSFDYEIEGPPDGITIENTPGVESYCGFPTHGESILTVYIKNSLFSSPFVYGTSPTSITTPTWTWVAVTGAVKYRYGFSEGSWITETAASTSYTPATPLSYGTFTLFVQAGDAAGNWTSSGSFTITILEGTALYYEIYGAQTGDYSLTKTGHQLIGTSNDGNTFNMTGYARFILYVPQSSNKILFDAIGLDSGWVNSQGGSEYAHLYSNIYPTDGSWSTSDTWVEGPPDGITLENTPGLDSYYGFSTMGASTLTVHVKASK